MAGRVRGAVLTPAQTAKAATAEASTWITDSPPLIDVLDWHMARCAGCGPEGRCTEYNEIIDEYGAGICGASVFYPAEGNIGDVDQPAEETRGGEKPGDWKVDAGTVARAAAMRAQLAIIDHFLEQCGVTDDD